MRKIDRFLKSSFSCNLKSRTANGTNHFSAVLGKSSEENGKMRYDIYVEKIDIRGDFLKN